MAKLATELFDEIVFNSHKNHNPTCDILEGQIDADTNMTYTINIETGREIMEYYSGENYNVNSSKPSYSRVYESDFIPAKYKERWNALKAFYENRIING